MILMIKSLNIKLVGLLNSSVWAWWTIWSTSQIIIKLCSISICHGHLKICTKVIEISIKNTQDARAHLDGQEKFNLQEGDVVRVARAAKTLTLLHPAGHNHFDMLREKLHWG